MQQRGLKLLICQYAKRIIAVRTEQSMVERKMRKRHTRILNDILIMSSNNPEKTKKHNLNLKAQRIGS